MLGRAFSVTFLSTVKFTQNLTGKDTVKKETILLLVVALAIGTLGGVIFSNTLKKTSEISQSTAPIQQIDYQNNITNLESLLAKDPTNRNGWVQLGHNYFDSNQPIKAIESYDKALEIDANDPDVLTDQGIMYRRVGWFEKAVTNFNTANRLNPQHVQSLYNLGIVYRDDFNDPEKAKEA